MSPQTAGPTTEGEAVVGPAKPKRAKVGLDLLREPFPSNQVSLLPKQVRRDDPDRGQCGGKYSADSRTCGGYHAKSIHLDYVGHAALTDRLLDADPAWTWEPVAFGPDGLPLMDKSGGLWIRLTVCGMTRLGYGDAQGKTGPNAVKEAIGDALRNAGMRFGAALDLWHKGDLHAAEVERSEPDQPKTAERGAVPADADPWASAPVAKPPVTDQEKVKAWEAQVAVAQTQEAFQSCWSALGVLVQARKITTADAESCKLVWREALDNWKTLEATRTARA